MTKIELISLGGDDNPAKADLESTLNRSIVFDVKAGVYLVISTDDLDKIDKYFNILKDVDKFSKWSDVSNSEYEYFAKCLQESLKEKEKYDFAYPAIESLAKTRKILEQIIELKKEQHTHHCIDFGATRYSGLEVVDPNFYFGGNDVI